MKFQALLWVIGCLLAVAYCVPSTDDQSVGAAHTTKFGSGPDGATASQDNPWALGADPVNTSNKVEVTKAATRVPQSNVLRREPDGHFYARASVNSHDIRFLIDTGASVIALTGPDADALGLRWSAGDIRPVGQGANGAVSGVPIWLEQVDLAGVSATNVAAVIIPDGLGVSLLGQNYLGQFSNVVINADQMVLEQ